MLIIPYSTEVVLTRWPLGNLAIIAACVLTFAAEATGAITAGTINGCAADKWGVEGLVFTLFIHGSILHLVFNMLYLWIFGNAVCEYTGSVKFVLLFLLCGVLGGVFWNMVDGRPSIGASGAIFGIIGFYLALFPVNEINCLYGIWMKFSTISISGYWAVALWFGLDLWAALRGTEDGIGHWTHIGGFISGLAIGILCLHIGLVKLVEYDNPTLLDYLKEAFARKEPYRRKAKPSENKLPIEEPAPSVKVRNPSISIVPAPPAQKPKETPESKAPAPEPDPYIIPLLKPMDDVDAECPFCGKAMRIPRAFTGDSIDCPSCGKPLQMPSQPI